MVFDNFLKKRARFAIRLLKLSFTERMLAFVPEYVKIKAMQRSCLNKLLAFVATAANLLWRVPPTKSFTVLRSAPTKNTEIKYGNLSVFVHVLFVNESSFPNEHRKNSVPISVQIFLIREELLLSAKSARNRLLLGLNSMTKQHVLVGVAQSG